MLIKHLPQNPLSIHYILFSSMEVPKIITDYSYILESDKFHQTHVKINLPDIISTKLIQSIKIS